jgi:hypothetical protein
MSTKNINLENRKVKIRKNNINTIKFKKPKKNSKKAMELNREKESF